MICTTTGTIADERARLLRRKPRCHEKFVRLFFDSHHLRIFFDFTILFGSASPPQKYSSLALKNACQTLVFESDSAIEA